MAPGIRMHFINVTFYVWESAIYASLNIHTRIINSELNYNSFSLSCSEICIFRSLGRNYHHRTGRPSFWLETPSFLSETPDFHYRPNAFQSFLMLKKLGVSEKSLEFPTNIYGRGLQQNSVSLQQNSVGLRWDDHEGLG